MESFINWTRSHRNTHTIVWDHTCGSFFQLFIPDDNNRPFISQRSSWVTPFQFSIGKRWLNIPSQLQNRDISDVRTVLGGIIELNIPRKKNKNKDYPDRSQTALQIKEMCTWCRTLNRNLLVLLKKGNPKEKKECKKRHHYVRRCINTKFSTTSYVYM